MGDTSKSINNQEKRALLAQLLQKKASQPKKFPLSFSQERLWFLDQFQPGTPIYNIPAAVGLPGPLNLEALKRTINEIVRRHEILPTPFATSEGRPVQVIAPSLSLDLPIIDLRRFSKSDRQGAKLQPTTEKTQPPLVVGW